MIAPGSVWKHYKGSRYVVWRVGKWEPDASDVVIYRSSSRRNVVWVRPVRNFLETIEYEGKRTARFKLERRL
jgi:hypothetical protein